MWEAYREDQLFKDIGYEPQFFFDNDVIAMIAYLTRTRHQPTKHGSNPLIVNDQPWEVTPYFRGNSYNVVRDPATGTFHCWYEDITNFFGGAYYGKGLNELLNYAVSDDGIHWRKPTFEKYLVDGKPTNVVAGFDEANLKHMTDPAIVLDENEPDPARRFKMLYYHRKYGLGPNRNATGYGCPGLYLATSPDGIDWTLHPDNPVYPGWGGDMSQCCYDPIDGVFVCHGRAGGRCGGSYKGNSFFAPTYPDRPTGVWGTRRRIYRAESPDLIHWSKAKLVFDPDHRDNLDDEHYGFIEWGRTSEWRLGILDVFHNVKNTVDCYFLHSRDKETWDRSVAPAPFIPRGPEGSYDCYDAETGLPPIEMGDELWFYYGGGRVHHDWWIHGKSEELDHPEAHDENLAHNGYGLCLATMRKDGYVSIEADVREGVLETKPIWSPGTELYINARCKENGYIRAEVTDNWGNLVWGNMDREHCVPFTGDAVRHKITWTEQKDLSKRGHFFKLRFYIKNAELYSFWFEDPAE